MSREKETDWVAEIASAVISGVIQGATLLVILKILGAA